MKKTSFTLILAITLLLSGCFHKKQEEKKNEATSAQTQTEETTSPEILEQVVKAQESGNIKNCEKLPAEHLIKQCKYNMLSEKENQ